MLTLFPFPISRKTLADGGDGAPCFFPPDNNELKNQSGLSNKKWDKAIKELTKNNLAKIEKVDDGLFVEVV